MTTISNAALIAAGKELLAQATGKTIPYVNGGMSVAGMDCQGLVEYLLIQCGIPKRECNLGGSNAHWRSSLKWSGTPEEAVKKFGCVPGGAVLFIWTEQETDKYAGDGMGDANHMGVYLGGESAIHASASRGCVAESVFKGKTIPNGGWNRVGLLKWVRHGTAWENEQTTGTEGDESVTPEMSEAEYFQESYAPASVQAYVKVVTPDGNPVKIREKHDTSIYKYKAPAGTVMLKTGAKDKYYKVIYQGKERLVDQNFVVACDARGNVGQG